MLDGRNKFHNNQLGMEKGKKMNDMETYIGVKIIRACPMSLTTYNTHYNKVIPATSGEEGYLVEYPDGYKSWSPKSVFEQAYRLISDSEKKLI